ncbi:MAG TPA: alpha/beta hydrolase-fold protein [Spirochaetota bacterium]|nr:alpha/beta hydrolase-fold protein [Spirochaetota bacterium]
MLNLHKIKYAIITLITIGSAFCSNKPTDTTLAINEDIYSINMKMDEYVIYSEIIGDYFKIDVSYMPDSNITNEKIPAFYTTDGQWRSIDHKYIHYLTYKKLIRPVYVIGVGYPQGYDYGKIRERDLTDNPDIFSKAFAKEIIPFIEEKYKIDPKHRILYGASYGGYFTLNSIFINESFRGLFETFISACPVAKTTSAENNLYEAAKKSAAINKNLYFGVGSSDHPYIVKTNENLLNILSTLSVISLNFSYYNYKDKDHYTVCRNVFIDGLLKYYGTDSKKTTGISDIIYQQKKYTFENPADLYDWSIMNSKPYDAAKKLSISEKDYSANKYSVKANLVFSKESTAGSIMTVFDHFENFKDKTFSAEIFVSDEQKGKYEIALKTQSTYNWITDESNYVTLDKNGWQKLVFNVNDCSKNGNPELLRAIGFSIRKANTSADNTDEIIFTNVIWK